MSFFGELKKKIGIKQSKTDSKTTLKNLEKIPKLETKLLSHQKTKSIKIKIQRHSHG
jgi:hypothetical protein